MSSQWWDPDGPMAPLHDFTPVRIDYILDSVRRLGTGGSANGVKGLRILDIGCGGGLLAEPMARLGGIVTGIDATAEAIEAADRAKRAEAQHVVAYVDESEVFTVEAEAEPATRRNCNSSNSSKSSKSSKRRRTR